MIWIDRLGRFQHTSFWLNVLFRMPCPVHAQNACPFRHERRGCHTGAQSNKAESCDGRRSVRFHAKCNAIHEETEEGRSCCALIKRSPFLLPPCSSWTPSRIRIILSLSLSLSLPILPLSFISSSSLLSSPLTSNLLPGSFALPLQILPQDEDHFHVRCWAFGDGRFVGRGFAFGQASSVWIRSCVQHTQVYARCGADVSVGLAFFADQSDPACARYGCDWTSVVRFELDPALDHAGIQSVLGFAASVHAQRFAGECGVHCQCGECAVCWIGIQHRSRSHVESGRLGDAVGVDVFP